MGDYPAQRLDSFFERLQPELKLTNALAEPADVKRGTDIPCRLGNAAFALERARVVFDQSMDAHSVSVIRCRFLAKQEMLSALERVGRPTLDTLLHTRFARTLRRRKPHWPRAVAHYLPKN